MKKGFTSFDVFSVLRELTGILNSRVKNVYQINPKTLLFKLWESDKPLRFLLMEAGNRFHLTSYDFDKPKFPSNFCMALRKYLKNSRLIEIKQHEFERIVVFTFTSKTGPLHLILEVFGNGNVTLVNSDNKILQSMSYRRMRDRNILRGEIFRFPPSRGKNPEKVSKNELVETLTSFDGNITKGMVDFLSIGRDYAEEILSRAKVDPKRTGCSLSSLELDKIFENLVSLFSEFKQGLVNPHIIVDENRTFIDVLPISLNHYQGQNLKHFDSFNEALDEYYLRVIAVDIAFGSSKVDKLRQEKDRFERMVSQQKRVSNRHKKRAEDLRKIAQLIYSNSGPLQELLYAFSEQKRRGDTCDDLVSDLLAKKEAGVDSAILFSSYNAKHSSIAVKVDGVSFDLTLNQDLFSNASQFFEQAKVADRKVEGTKLALDESCRKLEDVSTRLNSAQVSDSIRPVKVLEQLSGQKMKSKKWFEKYRWFVSSDGFLVVGGKDATSNEVLIKKYCEKHDIVFHADVVGAPFVVVKTNGERISDDCIAEAGEFAASFSRAWREGVGSADVYWVNPKQVTKSASSGEYLTRGAFMVRGKRNWTRGVPLQMAIGVDVKKEPPKVIGGPVNSVKSQTDNYLVVQPGNMQGKPLLHLILDLLTKKMSPSGKLSRSSIEDIREHVPFSRGRVVN